MDAYDEKPPSYKNVSNPDSSSFRSSSLTGHSKCAKCWSCVKPHIFLIFLLFGIITGIVMGIGIRANNPDFGEDERNLMYLGYPGLLLLRMLKCCIIPLIVTSLISGMASIPGQSAGRLGGLTVLYYMSTTFLAALLGILLVSTIKPGERGNSDYKGEPEDRLAKPVDSFLDLIRNAFPDNIIEACFLQTSTTYDTEMVNATAGNETELDNVIVGFSVTKKSGTNVLGLVVFCITLGIVIGKMGEAGEPVKLFVNSLQEAVIRVVKIVIWYSPIGIAFILAERIVGMADPASAFQALGWYMMTVLLGLAVHGLIFLPLIYFLCARKNPYKLVGHALQALLTALGTASSSATLPLTMQNMEENAGIDKRVTRFMLPVGATINMDGTALYEAVASIFIAQLNNYSLDAGQIVTISITATAAAIGAAGVPEAGLVTMVIVLTAVGLPTEDVGLIFAVDWLLDRFRTMINVWGDCIGTATVHSLCKKQLTEMDTLPDDTIIATVEGTAQKGIPNKGFEPETVPPSHPSGSISHL